MARQGNKLSALQVEKLVKKTAKPTWFGDGLGLYLMVRRKGDASWTFVYKINKSRRFLGLGPHYAISLQEARNRAAEARKLILDGRDPLAVKWEAKAEAKALELRTMTFEQAARQYLETDRIQRMRNPKHRKQWASTLETYAFPVFGNLPLQQIDSAIVLKALVPVWKRVPETGSRLRQRIEKVINWAKPLGLYVGDNPASREILADHLPAKRKAENFPAAPYGDMPEFMARLRARDSISARALEISILCAMRTGATVKAEWSEFDLKAGLWNCPAEHMKGDRAHSIPLPPRALAILKALPRRGDHVFINGNSLPISTAAMAELLKGMKQRSTTPGRLAVVHGFRSSFSDWCHDCTAFAPDVIEHCLAHTLKSKTAAAYRRMDALEKRAKLMNAWGRFCEGGTADLGATVTPIRA